MIPGSWATLFLGSEVFTEVIPGSPANLFLVSKASIEMMSRLWGQVLLADLAVFPSIWDEPAGLTMLEAIASGTPLITTNSGGIPEYAKDYNAVLLDVDDNLVNNISDKMKDILINKIESNTKNAMNCQKEYNLEVFLKRFVECIK